jgi:2-hydroxychromene-2-carboxylate isomerase
MSTDAQLYLDVISPFSYLYIKQFDELSPELSVDWVPVLFAGLLKRWESKGPAEIPTKRLHTYQWCAWRAQSLGIPFRMPPRHPMNPLAALRLLCGLGPSRAQFERAFDFVFAEGRDCEHDFAGLCKALGLGSEEGAAMVARPDVKQKLISNTDAALEQGVFGVPTLAFRGHIFWGTESIEWANALVADADYFERPAMRDAAAVEFGVTRRT